ncbi:MAG: DUF177 domain-containing protein [Pseudomonadota bacterium]
MAAETKSPATADTPTLEELIARPVVVTTLPKRGMVLKLDVKPDLLEALQERFELNALSDLEAEAHLAPWKRGGVRVEGFVRAALVQPCAVSGEPLNTTINEAMELTLLPAGSPLAVPDIGDTGELILDPDGADLPEIFEGDSIDIGGYWLEHFALGFDPYARIEGASFQDVARDLPLDSTGKESPFAALAALKGDAEGR